MSTQLYSAYRFCGYSRCVSLDVGFGGIARKKRFNFRRSETSIRDQFFVFNALVETKHARAPLSRERAPVCFIRVPAPVCSTISCSLVINSCENTSVEIRPRSRETSRSVFSGSFDRRDFTVTAVTYSNIPAARAPSFRRARRLPHARSRPRAHRAAPRRAARETRRRRLRSTFSGSFWVRWFERRAPSRGTTSMAEDYAITYCVKCKQKTEWDEPPTIKRTRNNLNGLRGACKRCNKTKFTFVSNAYMQNRHGYVRRERVANSRCRGRPEFSKGVVSSSTARRRKF